MSEWRDESMRVAEWMHNGINFLMHERNLLYGAIIYLMILGKVSEIELPPPEVLSSYGRDYYILFDAESKEGTVFIKLKERPEELSDE